MFEKESNVRNMAVEGGPRCLLAKPQSRLREQLGLIDRTELVVKTVSRKGELELLMDFFLDFVVYFVFFVLELPEHHTPV